jgi:VanZ family protein
MQIIKDFIYRWGMSILIMTAIFIFSSTPGDKLPNFGFIDSLVKKGGHMLGYGLLSEAYWHGLKWNKKLAGWAWILAVLYAITDEFHQSFISGRHPSLFDVFLFDATGAAVALWITLRIIPQRQD